LQIRAKSGRVLKRIVERGGPRGKFALSSSSRRQRTEDGRGSCAWPITAVQGSMVARDGGKERGEGGGLIPGLTSGRGGVRRPDDGSGRRRLWWLGEAALGA
jgi:hypothetical protein